jgi:hypothetical protein
MSDIVNLISIGILANITGFRPKIPGERKEMQKQELVLPIELIFEELFASEDYSRKLAGERFYRMNPTLNPLWGFEDVSAIEVLDAEESYCNLLMYG